MNKIQNFIPSTIDESTQWFLGDGCLPAGILFPDGHGWADFLPTGERQNKNGFETNNCTNYSLLNNIEAIGKKKYGSEFQNNLSERERGVRSGTTATGNNYQNVCECLRLQGVIPEAFLPFDDSIDTWEEYYSPRIIPFNLWKVSESWKKKYKYGHDWAFLPNDPLAVKRSKIKEALKYSPVSVAGYAWIQHEDGLYYNDGQANHAFDVYDFVEGQYWLALDSYPDNSGSFIKKLSWDYNFTEGKRHSLDKNLSGDSESEPTYFAYLLYVLGCYLKLK